MRSFASCARPTGCCAPLSIACSAARERSRIGCRRRHGTGCAVPLAGRGEHTGRAGIAADHEVGQRAVRAGTSAGIGGGAGRGDGALAEPGRARERSGWAGIGGRAPKHWPARWPQRWAIPRSRNLRRFLAAASTGEERIRAALENVGGSNARCRYLRRARWPRIFWRAIRRTLSRCSRAARADGGKPVSDQLRIAARRCMLRLVGRTLLEEDAGVGDSARAFAELRPDTDGRRWTRRRRRRALRCWPWDVWGPANWMRSPMRTWCFCAVRSAMPKRAERCALSLVAMLSGYTREGSVIAVDTRMRPHGSEGELVVSLRQLATVF